MSPYNQEAINLARDCPAVLVPSGQQVMLPQGTEVVIVQTLGGSFTVQSDRGFLARVAADDADALGLEPSDASSEGRAPAGPFAMENVMEQLKTVFDPEIPINVVDLGLVYTCDARPVGDGTYAIEIKMSMTAPGCGMGDVLKDDARARVSTVPGVSSVDVELVWDPPWDLSRMSEEARLQLGMW